jgi:hypothetical protein
MLGKTQQYQCVLAPRAGLTEPSKFSRLDCQTALGGAFDPQRQFGALSNHHDWCSHRQWHSPISVAHPESDIHYAYKAGGLAMSNQIE